MSTLHERLIEATSPLRPGTVLRHSNVNAPWAALRAVVELHAPDAESPWACDHCSSLEIPYPCSTIQAIARELGVDG